MRLFIAGDLSDATRDACRDAASRLSRALPQGAGAPRLVWVAAHAAHVTVRFIGEVPDSTLPAVEKALGPTLSHAPFDVIWHALGTFPVGRRPRAVWMGASVGAGELVTLAACVDARLAGVIDRRDGRPFAPHLTIARVKEAGRAIDWPAVVAGATPRATVTRIDHVTLYQSHVTSKGSTYTERLRIPLQ